MSKTYDVETIVTADIAELHQNVELGKNFDIDLYKTMTECDFLNSIKLRFPEELRLKTDIKVQVLLHEKDENAPKGE